MDKTVLPINLKIFEDKIKENKSGYLIGDSLTWTDLVLIFSMNLIIKKILLIRTF